MENKNLTAVEWLREKLFKDFGLAFSDNIFEEAKEMEKRQHLKTWMDSTHKYSFDIYYNKTYIDSEFPN